MPIPYCTVQSGPVISFVLAFFLHRTGPGGIICKYEPADRQAKLGLRLALGRGERD